MQALPRPFEALEHRSAQPVFTPEMKLALSVCSKRGTRRSA
jgi:hypothetical protein